MSRAALFALGTLAGAPVACGNNTQPQPVYGAPAIGSTETGNTSSTTATASGAGGTAGADSAGGAAGADSAGGAAGEASSDGIGDGTGGTLAQGTGGNGPVPIYGAPPAPNRD